MGNGQKVNALSTMNLCKIRQCLKFHQHGAFDDQVSDVFANFNAVIQDTESLLLRGHQPSFSQLMH